MNNITTIANPKSLTAR